MSNFATKAPTPAVICITLPLAKSRNPISPNYMPPDPQWVMGTQANTAHKPLNTTTQLERIRLAHLLTMKVDVNIAKVS